jgi:hypothetical protein
MNAAVFSSAGSAMARRAEDGVLIMIKTYHAKIARSITCKVIDLGRRIRGTAICRIAQKRKHVAARRTRSSATITM